MNLVDKGCLEVSLQQPLLNRSFVVTYKAYLSSYLSAQITWEMFGAGNSVNNIQ